MTDDELTDLWIVVLGLGSVPAVLGIGSLIAWCLS